MGEDYLARDGAQISLLFWILLSLGLAHHSKLADILGVYG